MEEKELKVYEHITKKLNLIIDQIVELENLNITDQEREGLKLYTSLYSQYYVLSELYGSFKHIYKMK